MTITGEKIVALGDDERIILQNAINVLDKLSEHIGNDEYYDFDDVADILYRIRHTDKFVCTWPIDKLE
jgi:hypothetical protein